MIEPPFSTFKEVVVYTNMEKIISEEKQCSKCKQYRPLDNFIEGLKLCQICLDANWRYRQKHKDEISQKYKEYYHNNKDDLLNKSKEKREILEFCVVCNRNIKKYDIKRHVNSKKHMELMDKLHIKNRS